LKEFSKLPKTNKEKGEKQQKRNGHNDKPLLSPEYPCNPPGDNTGVTAHSALHQDPEIHTS
jgi:hypothetical protein